MAEETKWEQTYSFNEKNELITKEKVEEIINKYIKKDIFLPARIHINNLDIYQKAFVHSNYIKEQHNLDEIDEDIFVPAESNERLEFLGDAIVGASVVTYLYNRFGSNEGLLTKLKIKLVKSESLCDWALKLGFDSLLLISSYMEKLEKKKQGRNNKNSLENSFEAFIGAIVMDNYPNMGLGYCVAYNFIIGIIETFIDFSELILINDNFKDSLIRYTNSQKWKHPTFYEVFKNGNTNEREFCVAILIEKNLIDALDNSEEVISKINTYQERIFTKLYSYEKCLEEELNKFIGLFEEHYCIGMGIGPTLKKSEQLAAKYGLMNINVKLNF